MADTTRRGRGDSFLAHALGLSQLAHPPAPGVLFRSGDVSQWHGAYAGHHLRAHRRLRADSEASSRLLLLAIPPRRIRLSLAEAAPQCTVPQSGGSTRQLPSRLTAVR